MLITKLQIKEKVDHNITLIKALYFYFMNSKVGNLQHVLFLKYVASTIIIISIVFLERYSFYFSDAFKEIQLKETIQLYFCLFIIIFVHNSYEFKYKIDLQKCYFYMNRV